MSVYSENLHIISFDVPSPPDYGGIMDVFYKIQALHELNIKIYLHCFEYGRGQAPELEKMCEKVFYYKRQLRKSYLFSKLPFIIRSRNSEDLLKNLLKDNYPILFEGLHCCYHLLNPGLAKRIRLVRMHNIEHEYYRGLADVEKNIFRRTYFNNEARKLKDFEKQLKKATRIISISPNDQTKLDLQYGNSIYIPAFHPGNSVEILSGKGKFCLYHGNLAIPENNEAALFLINNIFNTLRIPLIIAGHRPSGALIKAVKTYSNIEIRGDVTSNEMMELIRNAHINILPAFQSTGIKLKLIISLFYGRHCIANSQMVENTGLEDLCMIRNTPESIRKTILELIEKPFSSEEILKRDRVLMQNFSNKVNAEKIIKLLTH